MAVPPVSPIGALDLHPALLRPELLAAPVQAVLPGAQVLEGLARPAP